MKEASYIKGKKRLWMGVLEWEKAAKEKGFLSLLMTHFFFFCLRGGKIKHEE